jgi:outer membrane protein assembly factor BamB
MTEEVEQNNWGNNRLWNRIAIVAGAFALLTGILMIANYIQLKKADPISMTVVNTLVDRLNENPADSALRTEIRTLDLLSRKAYFTSQWQIRTGGYLLLAALAILVISLQIIEYRKKIIPVLSTDTADVIMLQNRKARRYIVIGGSIFLITAATFGFLSYNDLTDRLSSLSRGEEPSFEQGVASGNISVTDLNDSTAELTETGSATTEEIPVSASESTETTATAAAPASADNFPNFRGIGGTGIASKRNIPVSWDGSKGANVLWKTALPMPGQNSPIVWRNKVFATGASAEKQEVYCFDADNGKILWTIRVGSGTKKPTVTGETGYAAPTSVTDGKNVYAVFSTGDIAAIDMDGKKVWEKDLGLPDNYYGHASSLMLAGGNIIVQFDQRSSQKIMALATQTGNTVWSTNRQVKISWSSPIVVNTGTRNEIITVAEPYVTAYNPANGQELWKMECISGEVGPSLAYANGIVFSVNDYSKLSAIKLGSQPAMLWESNDYLSDIPSPVATDKYLFLATSYGTVVCYDAVTGQKFWEHDFGKSIYASPMIVENKVYLLDIAGVMHILSVDKEFKLIREPKLGEYSACTPAFTNGRIYLKGDKNLYCIGK